MKQISQLLICLWCFVITNSSVIDNIAQTPLCGTPCWRFKSRCDIALPDTLDELTAAVCAHSMSTVHCQTR